MPPLAEIWEVVWQAVLVPLAVSAVLFFIGLKLAPRRTVVVGLLAFIAGFAAGNHFREVLTTSTKLVSPLDWLPGLAVAAGVASLLPLPYGWIARLVVAVAFGINCVSRCMQIDASWVSPLFVFVLLLQWWVVERLERIKPALAPAVLALAIYSASIVLLYAHSARLSDIATIAGSGMLGIAIISLIIRCLSGLAGMSVVLPTTVMIGYESTYSDVPMMCFLIVALSPLLLLPCVLRPSRRALLISLVLFAAANVFAIVKTMQYESLPFD